MPHSYYNPIPLAPGEPPKPARICRYVFKDGTDCLAVICSVGDRHEAESDEYGPWYDCGIAIFPPNHGKLAGGVMTDPCADLRDGWRYFPKTATAYWCPCGPGTPQHPCP